MHVALDDVVPDPGADTDPGGSLGVVVLPDAAGVVGGTVTVFVAVDRTGGTLLAPPLPAFDDAPPQPAASTTTANGNTKTILRTTIPPA